MQLDLKREAIIAEAVHNSVQMYVHAAIHLRSVTQAHHRPPTHQVDPAPGVAAPIQVAALLHHHGAVARPVEVRVVVAVDSTAQIKHR